MLRYLLVLISLFLVSCENTDLFMMTDAATDAATAITLTDEDVKKLARHAAQAADGEHQVAPAGNPYDTRLRKLVARYSERDGYTFNFKVYLTRDVNAFATADGTVRIFSGLMDIMNDQELLFVVGHEMGHVVKNHSRKKVVMAYATSAVKKGLAAQENEVGQIARSMVGDFAEQLTNAQFSQHEERQADQYGATLLQAGGHDISPAISALEKLADLARRHTFLSSHPDPAARALRLSKVGIGEDEDRKSLTESLSEYGQKLLLGLLDLIRSVIAWVISWL